VSNVDDVTARFTPDDPEFIADPYPVLNEIREATPVFWNEASGQWLLTRFDDASAMLRSRSLGRNYSHRYSDDEFGQPGLDPRWPRFNEHERWSLLFLEPPDHTRIRRLISSVFTPRSVAALTPTMLQISDRLLDRCAETDTFDLLADYAQPYSVAVICALLGAPPSDTAQLLDWSHAIVKMYELDGPDHQKQAADKAAGQFIDYVADLIAHKRRHPDGLLISELAMATDDGTRLTDAEITSTVMVLLEAGHEATVNTLGNGFRALLTHRDQWRRLTDQTGPDAVGPTAAVEELLRWDSPLQLFARWVLEPIELAGRRFEVGDQVGALFGSAQRDPRRFDDPDRFDIGRNDAAHIGFGGGIHHCVGAALARSELALSVGSLAERFPNMTLADQPRYYETFVLRGLEQVLVLT
jgi:cytochrome P450